MAIEPARSDVRIPPLRAAIDLQEALTTARVDRTPAPTVALALDTKPRGKPPQSGSQDLKATEKRRLKMALVHDSKLAMRSLFARAHAPNAMHDELTEDYRDMIYAGTAAEVETRAR